MSSDPKKRPSALSALEHNYFFEKSQSFNNKKDFLPIRIDSGTHITGNNTPLNLDLSKESLGSTSLVTRKPVMNGRIDTFEKMSHNYLNSSAGNLDIAGCLTPKKEKQSKFFPVNVNNGHIEETSGFALTKKKSALHQEDLHKKAIINNLNKKDFDEERKF